MPVFSLCAAPRMGIKHCSVVIVSQEDGLEVSAGLMQQIVFYSCHGEKIVPSLPYNIVIESWKKQDSSSSRGTLLRKAAARRSRENQDRSKIVPRDLHSNLDTQAVCIGGRGPCCHQSTCANRRSSAAGADLCFARQDEF